MKKKFKIIDAVTGEKIKLKDGQKLSDVCPQYEVVWNV